MITLIKYDNRKVYSKEYARYVNAEDIAVMLVTNQKVKVVSHKDSTDVTHSSLVHMGATMIRTGNLDAGRMLIRYADSYRAV